MTESSLRINRASYAAAQEKIRAGKWIVDADQGAVRRRSGRVLGHKTTQGYVVLGVTIDGRTLNVRAHRVIWESIYGPIPDGLEINHLNSVRHDNRIVNLELVDRSGNMAHAVAVGRLRPAAVDAMLTDDHLAVADLLAEQGWTQTRIASTLGFTRQALRLAHRRLRGTDAPLINHPAECGSRSGYYKHLRAGTAPCQPCREASRAYDRERHRRAKSDAK